MMDMEGIIKEYSRDYNSHQNQLEDQLSDVMICVYERVTGKRGSNVAKFKEAIMEAIGCYG